MNVDNRSVPHDLDPESRTWPVVQVFAHWMEHKLSLNRHKGDREGTPYEDDPGAINGGWLYDAPSQLYWRVLQEMDELRQAITNGAPFEDVAAEAADVANMAMMMADAYGWKRERRGLMERPPSPEPIATTPAPTTQAPGEAAGREAP